MRPDEFYKLLKNEPFRPFRIHLTNGKNYEVRHPEFVTVFRSVIHIGQPASGYKFPILEDYEVVSLLHINNFEYLTPIANQPTDGNGQ